LRILVADDQEYIRQGIRALIEAAPGLEVCGEAVNGEEAVQKTIEMQPDLVVLDITMPVMNGLDAAKMIRSCSPDTPILIVSIHNIETMIEDAKRIGVQGFVAKAQASELLVDAIQSIMQHQKYFPKSRTHVN
jgi:DNA-binding NarL/FixJ family response regulator